MGKAIDVDSPLKPLGRYFFPPTKKPHAPFCKSACRQASGMRGMDPAALNLLLLVVFFLSLSPTACKSACCQARRGLLLVLKMSAGNGSFMDEKCL